MESPVSMPVHVRRVLVCIAAMTVSLGCGTNGASRSSHQSSRRMADGKEWTTANLDLEAGGSYCYDNVERNCRQYGRLYTWGSALQACRSLGDRWRLPSDDDWKQLTKHYGGSGADSGDNGKGAYKALLPGGAAGFNAVLGGGRSGDGQYARLNAHGFYWTASENNPAAARFYNFARGSLALYRQPDGEKERAFSVRCVRE
jgi:uncharacterized protein (TIGR02145 family)